MRRTQVSELVDIDKETLRYYERLNLISRPQRLSNGYRTYNEKNLEEIKFIKHCRSLDIPLVEIKSLMLLRENTNDCSDANQIIKKNMDLIEEKIKDLNLLYKQLKSLSGRCKNKGPSKNCGIVKSLIADSKKRTKTRTKNN